MSALRAPRAAGCRSAPGTWSCFPLGAILFALPLIWMVLSSFMSNAQINQFPPTIIPDSLHLDGWQTVFGDSDFPRWFLNSTIVALVTVVSNLVFCSLAGYAFARLRFRGSTVLFLLILLTLIIPFQLTMIPTFIVMDKLGLVDTLGGADRPAAGAAARRLPDAPVLRQPPARGRGGRPDRRLLATRRAAARRAAAREAGAGDARRAHLPADVERPAVAADRDQLRREGDPAARA